MSTDSCRRLRSALAALLLGSLYFSLPLQSQAGIGKTGRWTAVSDWAQGNNQRYAIHLLLLRGDHRPYHSRVLWFRGEGGSQFSGGQWGWQASQDTCLAWPTASFDSLGMDASGVNFFCGGHATLADGRLMLVSGTSPSAATYGENRTRIFTAGAGNEKGAWTESDSLEQWRWYSTATTLADGRILVTAGARHRYHRAFGGRRNSGIPADTEGDEMHRFSGVVGGKWEDPVTPLDDGMPADTGDPEVREHHSLIEMGHVANFDNQVLFGGRDRDGLALNDAWKLERHNNPLGDDYQYRWNKFDGSNSQGSPPDHRSDHTAVAALRKQMVVFGGIDNEGAARKDAHRLYWNAGTSKFQWEAMEVSGEEALPPRLGHQASYQETRFTSGAGAGTTEKAMYVFGGTEHPDSLPEDDRVWKLVFDPANDNQGTWEEVAALDFAGGPRPSARWGHAVAADTALRTHPDSTHLKGRVTLFYGGELEDGTYSDSLWALWHLEDGSTRWQHLPAGGTNVPGPRAHHAMTLDGAQGDAPTQQPGGRLYLFGGLEGDAELADRSVYVLDPWHPNGRTWQAWESMDSSFVGHTFTLELGGVSARIPEAYDPDLNDWAAFTDSPLLDRNYPITFSVPRSGNDTMRVLTIPSVEKPYYLDIPETGAPEAWQASSAAELDFVPLNAVLYRPDRMMIGGARAGTVILDTTLVFDVTNLSSGEWQTVGSRHHKRYHHNLVILPTGEVLAVGGVGTIDENQTANPRFQPELWDPESGNWTTSPDGEELASQTQIRDYHSTSLLLPDGRVLSSGGQNALPDRGTAELYCPPYLFKTGSDQAADRPVIDTTTATTVAYGQRFTVCVEDTTGISRAVLLRPGATTHSFDQNQRYAPLGRITKAADPPRLHVTAPASPDSAPPGDYMLFLTGSPDGPDVPSIAHWVRLTEAAGTDACDGVAPDSIADLTPDLISQNAVYFIWHNSADDRSLGASGRISTFDFRRSLQHINNESGWSAALAETGEPSPDSVGVEQSFTADSLQNCTDYYFALRAGDDASNLSALHPQVKAKTLCPGGGGGGDPGGATAEVVNAETGDPVSTSRGEMRRAGLSTQSGGGTGSAAALVVESEPLTGGAWRFTLQAPAALEGVDVSTMLRQVKDAAGAWRTQSALDLASEDSRIGLCATGRAGRKIFPGTWGLMEIASTLRSSTGDLALVSADHSSAGDLAEPTWSGDGSVSLGPGETLELTYEPSQRTAAATENWFALLQRTDAATTATRDGGPAAGPDLPTVFALYQNQPNPFRGTTAIRFDLPKPTPVRLTIYDIAGRKVRTLARGDQPAGRHSVTWDHRSDAGVALGSGAYIYRIVAGDHREERKMILLP